MGAEMPGGPGAVAGTVVVRQSRAQRDGVFGGTVVLFVLGFARGFHEAQTTGGKIAVTILCGGLVILMVTLWTWSVRHPCRLEVTSQAVSYIDGNGMVKTLHWQSGEELRFVVTGNGRYSRRRLMVTGSSTALPLPFFSSREIRKQTMACGWQFRGGRPARR